MNFARIISSERKRLEKTREKALARKADIDRELAALERELTALKAFFSAKQGASARTNGGAGRARRGEKRQQIMDLIKSVPEGLTRGEIIQKLEAVEKSAQQSISNALSNLFKSNALTRNGRKYLAA